MLLSGVQYLTLKQHPDLQLILALQPCSLQTLKSIMVCPWTASHASYPCDLLIWTAMCLKRHSHFKCKQKPFWVRKHRENKANINCNLEVIAGVIEAGWHSPPRTVQPNGGRHIIYARASALFVETYPRRVIDKLI